MRFHNFVVSGFMPRSPFGKLKAVSRGKPARYGAFVIFWLVILTTCSADPFHVHMLSGSAEYKSEESLKQWADHLKSNYGIESTFSLGTDRSTVVDGLEQMKEADALVIFCRRWELEEEQGALVREAITSGIPILGIRTASHAFEFFKEFDKAVLGGNYQGHTREAEPVSAGPRKEQIPHPVLKGITGWEHTGKLYYNPDLAGDVSVLLAAQSSTIDAPLAWVRMNGKQRIFYTSMGYPEDFRNLQFTRMLDNALFWVSHWKPVMKPLAVSKNNRFLITADGEPFFWQADTAWELFHRLNREETLRYLNNRAARRFNVIQAVALAEQGGLEVPNRFGELCFFDKDPRKPNPAYFEHVDWVIDQAASRGLHVALLPTWAAYVGDFTWPQDEIIFDPQSAESYGKYLGTRYKDCPNIVWVLGGDRPCEKEQTLETWRAMAAGIRSAGATQVITWHPPGGRSSADYIHEEDWLDFNMIQSSHFRRHNENWLMVEKDYHRTPVKPTLDAEPCYEEIALGFDARNGIFFNDYDVRMASWWSVLAGGMGITYGCHAIWQMWTPEYPEACGKVLRTWEESLDLPGASQVQHLRALVESRPFFSRRPDQSLVIEEWPCSLGSADHVAVSRDGDEAGQGISYIIAYSPILPINVQIRTDGIADTKLQLWAYNPRTGEAIDMGLHENTGKLKLPHPPSGPDWAYVIDAVEAGYPAPGK